MDCRVYTGARFILVTSVLVTKSITSHKNRDFWHFWKNAFLLTLECFKNQSTSNTLTTKNRVQKTFCQKKSVISINRTPVWILREDFVLFQDMVRISLVVIASEVSLF